MFWGVEAVKRRCGGKCLGCGKVLEEVWKGETWEEV